jgi:ATP-dependent helicase/nuclease subunit B
MTLPAYLAVPNVRGFLPALADFIEAQHGFSFLDGHQTIIILPTRRSGRQFQEILIKKSPTQAIIPPHITTFTDVQNLPFLKGKILTTHQWQNVASLMRILAPLLDSVPVDVLLKHAQRLLPLLEEWTQHQLPQKNAAGSSLVPHHFAAHLQDNLKLFWTALAQFPSINLTAFQRQIALQIILEYCRDFRLIIATEAPQDQQILEFLVQCSKRPHTHIFLLGCDSHFIFEKTRSKPQPYHPHYGFSRLLQKMGISTEHIALFPETNDASMNRRQKVLRRIFGDDRLMSSPIPNEDIESALQGVSLLECDHQQAEALTIAIILREALETPGQRIALVTPDRQLASFVKIHLRRWQIDIDDSAGEPFFATPAGTFLKLTAECMLNRFAPVSLLSLLKHPYFSLRRPLAAVRQMARHFEREWLRKPDRFLNTSLKSWPRLIDQGPITSLLSDLEHHSAMACELACQEHVSFKELLHAHIGLALRVATSPEAEGHQILFSGEMGQEIFNLLQDILHVADHFPPIKGQSYLQVLAQLLQGIRVRKTYGYHPRLFILDPLQAQLQDFDCVVLGGLNAGMWPTIHEQDPWLSQEMRQACGLPTLAHQFGIAVQHFINLFAAPRVLLTRAQKVQGTLSLASPWLQRLQAVLRAHHLEQVMKPSQEWLAWQRGLDMNQDMNDENRPLPFSRPRPCPPLAQRPRELSVTEVLRLFDDPYALYAHKILKLRALHPLEGEPGSAFFGNLLHQIMEAFFTAPEPSLSLLLDLGERFFRPFQKHAPVFYGLYWPKFAASCPWLLEQYSADKEHIAQTLTEVQGYLDLAAPAGPFRLTAVADRIDIMTDGSLRIIDYKTGTLPPSGQIQRGDCPQLLLEALIAQYGRFKGVRNFPLHSLEFWQLGRHSEGGQRFILTQDLDHHIKAMQEKLNTLIAFYDQPDNDYQPAWHGAIFCPYTHLARRAEWSTPLL